MDTTRAENLKNYLRNNRGAQARLARELEIDVSSSSTNDIN